jgi:hypothetical protein
VTSDLQLSVGLLALMLIACLALRLAGVAQLRAGITASVRAVGHRPRRAPAGVKAASPSTRAHCVALGTR